jgi:hypothetical protein
LPKHCIGTTCRTVAGLDTAAERERGTGSLLDALGATLAGEPARF